MSGQNPPSGPAANTYDSLLRVLKTAKEDTNKVNTLNKLAREIELSGNDNEGISYANEAKRLSEKIDYRKGLSSACLNLGNLYSGKGEFPLSLEYYFAALKIDEEINNQVGIATILGNIGIVYTNQGDYPGALEICLKALKMREKLGEKGEIAKTLSNLGLIYIRQGDHFKALEYFYKALDTFKELGDRKSCSALLGNIGIVFKEQGDNARALDHFFKALRIAEELDNKNFIAIWLSNIGNAYLGQGDSSVAAKNMGFAFKEKYPKALDYYFKALKLNEELERKSEIAIQLANIGSVYSKTRNFIQSEEFLKKAAALSHETGYKEASQEIHQNLSALYEVTGKYGQAYRHYKLYIVYKDSLQNEENTRKQTRMEMQYDFDKKQTADSIQNSENTNRENLKHDQEIQQQKLFTYGCVIGFSLMIIVAGVSYRAYRQKRKANGIIYLQKLLVEEKQKEILDSIHYAERIQLSLLPSENYFHKNLSRMMHLK